jgi:hypothetical protein
VRLFSRSADRRPPPEPPLERIASLLETASTAQFAGTMRFPGTGGWDMSMSIRGCIDFDEQLIYTVMRVGEDAVELFQSGTEAFVRLDPELQEETGKIWGRSPEPDPCPYGDWRITEQAAGIRHLGESFGHAVEVRNGETLHHHVIQVRPRRSEADPDLAILRDHLRWHGTDRQVFDVWLSEDGQIRIVKEQYGTYRYGRDKAKDVTMAYWDFGTAVDLRPPAPEEILDDPL